MNQQNNFQNNNYSEIQNLMNSPFPNDILTPITPLQNDVFTPTPIQMNPSPFEQVNNGNLNNINQNNFGNNLPQKVAHEEDDSTPVLTPRDVFSNQNMNDSNNYQQNVNQQGMDQMNQQFKQNLNLKENSIQQGQYQGNYQQNQQLNQQSFQVNQNQGNYQQQNLQENQQYSQFIPQYNQQNIDQLNQQINQQIKEVNQTQKQLVENTLKKKTSLRKFIDQEERIKNIKIPNTEKGSHVQYVITFLFEEKITLTIKKRYNDFYDLHTFITKLGKEYSSAISSLPPFPGKTLFPNIEKRKVDFEKYLQVLITKSELMKLKQVYEFFVSETSTGGIIPTICSQTKFTKPMAEEIYNYFETITDGNNFLTKDQFIKVFPFLNEKQLQTSLFRAIDSDGGDTIAFEEFITALSIMTHGSNEEKAELALKIIDYDGDKKITKSELLSVTSNVMKIINEHVPELAKNFIISPEEVVEKVFRIEKDDEKTRKMYVQFESEQKTLFTNQIKLQFNELKNDVLQNIKEERGISFEEFIQKAGQDSYFLSCFGLFTVFEETIVVPIEKKTFANTKYVHGYPTIEGYVTTKDFVLENPYVQIINGFMNVYQSQRHCMVHDSRWNYHQSFLNEKTLKDSDEIVMKSQYLLKEQQNQCILVAIKNCTTERFHSPEVIFYSQSQSSNPPQYIDSNNDGAIILTGDSHMDGFISYQIGETKLKFIVLFNLTFFTHSIPNFEFYIESEGLFLNEVVFNNYKSKITSKLNFNSKAKDYHMVGLVSDANPTKIISCVEVHHQLDYPLPYYVLDLTEANVSKGKSNSFILSTPIFNKKEIWVEREEIVYDWISTIQEQNLKNPYGSFAPIRKESACRYFIAGQEYFEELAKCLKQAKTEILITGWFITPELHLTRKKENGEYTDRLDHIILKKAQEGVKIYVCVWFEIELAFEHGSKLMSNIWKHPNVSVVRDPLDMFGIWSHHQKTCIIDQVIGFCGGIDIAYNRFETLDYPVTDEEENNQLFPGRDYVNPMIPPLKSSNIGSPYEDVHVRKNQCRMPWQDIQVKVVGESARDLARNFIQRYNKSKTSTQPFLSLRNTIYSQDQEIQKLNKLEPYENCNIQPIRSASFWSMGLMTIENSIYQSQLDAIKNSKHFIYIENQFFVSALDQNQVNPLNKILKAIVERLSRAIENDENFKLIFVTPIHSASPLNQSTIQKLTYWQLSSFFKGKKSLFGCLKEKYPNVNIDKYLTVSCLRNWGQFKSGVYATEMLYVHSKLMIVDDSIAFISSANVNDRSMMGNRDSEIGVRIEDNEEVEITMGGQKFKARKFAHELRCKLQILFTGGIGNERILNYVKDPIVFYDIWVKISHSNRDIFVDVFQMIEDVVKKPDDVHYLMEFNHILKARNVERLKDLNGYVVPYPSDLLLNSYFQPNENDPTSKFFC